MKPEDVITPRRRSARLSAPEEEPVDKPVVVPPVPQRKTFSIRKIVPRKTQLAELNKENDERLSNIPEKRPKVSTPASEKTPNLSTPVPEKKTKVSTPSSEKRPKGSTPLSEKRPKGSTPSSEKRPKKSTPAPEKKPKVCTPSSEKRPKVSTPAPVDASPPSPTVLSPIVATQNQSPPRSATDKSSDAEVWSQKVRRSYSRLSGDASFVSPGQQHQQGLSSPVAGRRETLFGFEKMPTPKVIRPMSTTMLLSASAPQASSSMCGVSALNLSDAEDSLNRSGAPDLNIPGVAIQKKHAKKKKVQPITMSELDVLAAQMNAEFAEAEDFELVVE